MDGTLAFPHTVETEEAFLSTILRDASFIHQAAALIKPEYFYIDRHQLIFQACLACYQDNLPPESYLVGVVEVLRAEGRLADAGGARFIAELAINGLPITEGTIRYHTRILLDMAKRRQMIYLAGAMLTDADDLSKKDYMEAAQGRIMEIQGYFAGRDERDMEQAIDDALVELKAEMQAPFGITGLRTGFPKLDQMTGGLKPGQFVAIGARPGNGKTTLATNIATFVALEEKKPVVYFSLEMQRNEILKRAYKSVAMVTGEWGKLEGAARALKEGSRFKLDDRATLTILEIQMEAQLIKALYPDLGLVVIDHLSLIAPEAEAHKKYQNKNYELAFMTRTVKLMGKILGCPIILCCQLNRLVESRQVKKPVLSDLRDTGSTEQDADIVLFPVVERDERGVPTGRATISVAKQRDGVTGEIPLIFYPALTRFKEV